MSNEELEKNNETELDPAPEATESDMPSVSEESVTPEDRTEPTEEQTEQSDAPKASAKKGGKNGGKLCKLIYYPVLALAALIMLVFSIIDGVFGYKPSVSADYYKAVDRHISALAAETRSQFSSEGVKSAADYIVDALKAGGFNSVAEKKVGEDDDDEEDVRTVTDWAKPNNMVPAPTVTVMTSDLDEGLQSEMSVDKFLLGATVTDVIAAIPSSKTVAGEKSDAIVITARYDSRTDTVGAAENAAFVANLIQTLIEYKKAETAFANDIIVVFTEDLDCSYGTRAFFAAFDGLDDVVSRAKAGINLDAYGNGGTLALTDASGAGLDYVTQYTSVSGSAFNSSIVAKSIPSSLKTGNAIEAFGDIPAIQVAVLGGLENSQSQFDTAANISKDIVCAQADFIKNYIDCFGNTAKTFTAENGELGFFSYLDGGTIAYNAVASYVIGAIILALLGAAIAVIVVKKRYSITKILTALGALVLAVASTLVAMYAAYFLVTLMLTGFGVIPLHAITEIRAFNAGLIIAAMLVAVAGMFGFSSLYKKLFKVTASDVVRGNALLCGLAGAVMCFAAPAYSYVICWFGLLSLVVLLISACVKNAFKAKTGFGIDRLFLFTVPAILCLPLMLSATSALMQIVPLVMLPLIMLLFVALISTCVPYLDRTKTALDKLAKKLPMRTVRVERVVEEKIEDKAKKGKFTVRTVKKVENEKVAVNYKTYFGVSVIAVIGVVVALFSGGFGVDFGKTLTAPHAFSQAEYNDALVYECVIGSDGTAKSQQIVVDDLIAYKYIRYAVADLQWDSVAGRYTKPVTGNLGDIVYRVPAVTRLGSNLVVQTFDGPHSVVTITIPSASNISEITVHRGNDSASLKYTFDGEETIVLRLPYGYCNESPDFILEFKSGEVPSSVEYEERRSLTPFTSDRPLANLDDWNAIISHFNGTDVANNIRGAIVLKRSVSL